MKGFGDLSCDVNELYHVVNEVKCDVSEFKGEVKERKKNILNRVTRVEKGSYAERLGAQSTTSSLPYNQSVIP